MRTVLVTGAAGFIGSHLSQKFLDAGYIVFGIDDHTSSNRNSPHLTSLLEHKRFQFSEISVENTDAMMQFARSHDFDLILNFACPASPPRYQQVPLKTLNTCYLGTRNVLTIARLHSSRVVHASTSEIYGDPVSSPQKETDWGNVNCFGPRSMYDEGKRVAETLCREYLELGVNVRIVRIFNTYGPHMQSDDGRVITNFINQALRNDDITIYGDGSQTRSFCYVDDLVDGIVSLSNVTNPGHPINIGNPNEFTMLELANLVIELTGTSSRLVFNPLPKDDPRQRRPDISRANELLSWNPRVQLREGLVRTIDYFRSLK